MRLVELTEAQIRIVEMFTNMPLTDSLTIQKSRDGKADTYFVKQITEVKEVIHSRDLFEN